MRNPRFAYKKEEQSKVEIVETLTKCTFPLSNDQVRQNVSFNMLPGFFFFLLLFFFQTVEWLNNRFHGFFQPLFAFQYKDKYPVDGWKVYDPVAEYKRMVRHVLTMYVKSISDSSFLFCSV